MTLTLFSVDAQTTKSKTVAVDNRNQSKREFKNQGEQEDYSAEQLFKKDYSVKHFNKFKGDLLVNGNNFNYDGQILQIVNTSKELTNIFSKGLFYPAVITGDIKTVLKSKQELDTLSAGQKLSYYFTRTDSLTISNFEELKFLTKNDTQKKFRFWLFRKGFPNPTVCFIELTNYNASGKTNLTTFINGATLTFFKSGWIVI